MEEVRAPSVKTEIKRLSAVGGYKDITSVIGACHRAGVRVWMNMWV